MRFEESLLAIPLVAATLLPATLRREDTRTGTYVPRYTNSQIAQLVLAIQYLELLQPLIGGAH